MTMTQRFCFCRHRYGDGRDKWGFVTPDGCEKRHFLRHLYIKCIFLPRQARDKHRENSKKSGVLCSGQGHEWRYRGNAFCALIFLANNPHLSRIGVLADNKTHFLDFCMQVQATSPTTASSGTARRRRSPGRGATACG